MRERVIADLEAVPDEATDEVRMLHDARSDGEERGRYA